MAKSSKIKVPKQIVGVKIPKAVRKGPIMDFVNSKTGRVLIAQALTAAIGVFAYKQASPETRERVGGKVSQGADDAREYMSRNMARLSFAFGEAVTAFRTALAQPMGQSMEREDDESAAAPGIEDGKKKKKQNWSSSEPANGP
jgi:hypothetical protein